MTQTQFKRFHPRAQQLLARYAAGSQDPFVIESLDLQVHQLLREYAPGTLFEKRLAVEESGAVLLAALEFYQTLLCGPQSKE